MFQLKKPEFLYIIRTNSKNDIRGVIKKFLKFAYSVVRNYCEQPNLSCRE